MLLSDENHSEVVNCDNNHGLLINMTGLLESFRVLDLTDHKGFFCGKILADLGADVIKVEKPGGDPARRKSA